MRYLYAVIETPLGKRELEQDAIVNSVAVFDHVLTQAELDAWPDYLMLDDGMEFAAGDRYHWGQWTRNVDGVEVALPIENPNPDIDEILAILEGGIA